MSRTRPLFLVRPQPQIGYLAGAVVKDLKHVTQHTQWPTLYHPTIAFLHMTSQMTLIRVTNSVLYRSGLLSTWNISNTLHITHSDPHFTTLLSPSYIRQVTRHSLASRTLYSTAGGCYQVSQTHTATRTNTPPPYHLLPTYNNAQDTHWCHELCIPRTLYSTARGYCQISRTHFATRTGEVWSPWHTHTWRVKCGRCGEVCSVLAVGCARCHTSPHCHTSPQALPVLVG